MTRPVSIGSARPSQKPQLVCSTCPYCGVGCGVDIQLASGPESADNKITKITGTQDHPANFGRLCVKGSNLLETNGLEGRLLEPEVYGQTSNWGTATDLIAEKITEAVQQHGPDAVAFYVSGQLLTEDYYVANKLMKGFIGSANIDTNSRLCMSSAVAAYKRAFGEDLVPCSYDDLEDTELLVLIGSNAAWTHPVLFQRIERAKKKNPNCKIVLVDPRQTATSSLADLHLSLKPGSDAALFNGLLHYLVEHNVIDQAFVEQHTEGLEKTLQLAGSWTPAKVAEYCDLAEPVVLQFYRWFATSQSAISFYSMGINQSTSGVDKANAIINCHLVTGKIGRRGCGPFSITGQPNAMGGREVGGLANMLAAHMDLENPEHRHWVQEYWQSPHMPEKPGLKAVDLFDALSDGKVKVLWIMATNPLVSMPNRAHVEKALKQCDLVIVSDCVAQNDTLDLAHVKLPATGWSEKNGTVTNSERRISRQHGVLDAPGLAKHDWQIMCDVAAKMGFSAAFDYQHPSEIFAEHAGLTAVNNAGARALDLSGLRSLSKAEYDALKPIQWPVNHQTPQGKKRLFSDGRFYTATGRARFIPIDVQMPHQQVDSDFPFVLNTGRLRDQWHTMTRTGKTPHLLSHQHRPMLDIHPKDAEDLGVVQGQLVRLQSRTEGATDVILPANHNSGQRVGEVFAPIHWSGSWGSHGAVASAFTSANDPISGQPELKHGAVRLQPCDFSHYAQVFSRKKLDQKQLQAFSYWQQIPVAQGYMVVLAEQAQSNSFAKQIRQLQPSGEWLVSISVTNQAGVCLADQQLLFAYFIDQEPVERDREAFVALFESAQLSASEISGLLRGQVAGAGAADPLVCSCFQVAESQIQQAIEAGASSVEALGMKLKCGTNCGSCKPELQALLANTRHQDQADDNRIPISELA